MMRGWELKEGGLSLERSMVSLDRWIEILKGQDRFGMASVKNFCRLTCVVEVPESSRITVANTNAGNQGPVYSRTN